MIPKTIHYCWFGRGEKPRLAKKCIASWKKYMPGYDIVEWNEDNFDVHMNDYTRFTYEHKLYAYLSDYARLWAVEKHGGIYLDTDVEVIKPFDELLKNEAFLGFETEQFVNTGLGFGAVEGQQAVRYIMKGYEQLSYEELDEAYKKESVLRGSPKRNTYPLLECGLVQNGERQTVLGMEIFPKDYFCPLDDLTGILSVTDHTFSIHWFNKSANSRYAKIKSKFSRVYHRVQKLMGH